MDNQETGSVKASPKKKFFTKKKIIWSAIILLAVLFIGYRIFKSGGSSANIQTGTAQKQNLKLTVLATGQVVSSTDLQLSFKSGGIVSRVNVKEGDVVKAGTLLASLSQSDQAAALTQAQGSLAQAQANYQKVLAGASSEDVAVAQVTLDNAKTSLANATQQQQVLVDNAYKALMNSSFTAVPSNSNNGSTSAAITGTYLSKDQGIYKITIYNTGAGQRFRVEGLETGDGLVSITPQPLGTRGLNILFSDIYPTPGNSWTVTIPNPQASTYVANYNSYQAALQTQTSAVSTAQSAVTAAQAALDLKKAQARPADVAVAQAQILSAQGQVQAAQSAWENTNVRAPADGTVTQVDIKVGEQAAPSKEVFVLQDVGNLHIEAQVSEANIASVQPGQSVDVTFDALGPDRHFNAAVQTVNPASTLVSGVVNYKVTASVNNVTDIKPGMTANMTILVAQKDNVLAIPESSVVNNNDGSKTVKIITDDKTKAYKEVPITTGLEADGGMVEILSGINEGQEVVTYIKK